jgi:hypothetical protein
MLLSFFLSTALTLQPTLPHRRIANLSLGLISQDLPQNLSRRVLGNRVDEFDTAHQPLVLGHFRRQPRSDILLRRTLAVFLQRDVSARQLFAVDGDSHNRSVLHGWVVEEEGFEFGRGDLVAFDFDELLRKERALVSAFNRQLSEPESLK